MTASTKTRRWMETAFAQAQDRQPALPWARGARRAEMIARRTQREDAEQSKALRRA